MFQAGNPFTINIRQRARRRSRRREALLIRITLSLIALIALLSASRAADPVEIKIGYLGRAGIKPTLSLVDLPAENDGVAGARLAIEDNNTTGKFLNQRFVLEEVRLNAADDPAATVAALAARGVTLIIADLPGDALLKA